MDFDFGKLEELMAFVSNVDIDVKDGELDEDVLKFYKKRFAMFSDDDCPEAVEAYLHKLKRDTSISDITKIAILREALNY